MYSFRNDYSEGAHPRILQALADCNLEQANGYGSDTVCREAADLIRARCAAPNADVHFVSGGTQANLLVIHAALRTFESVISADSGHINTHESGAIEATAHKVCPIPSPDGKLTAELIRRVYAEHSGELMVRPKMVYISNATETGSVYTKAELTALRAVCSELGLYLFLDGARLGSAMAALGGELTLADLAALTDAFTIGGTKNGALIGEAIVLVNPDLQPQFRWHLKQRGAMLAKGRLLGIQFRELLRDDLYFELAAHANAMAQRLREGVAALGYEIPVPSVSNLFFPVFPNDVMGKMQENYAFELDRPVDDEHTLIRLVTSWATPVEAVDAFLADLAKCR